MALRAGAVLHRHAGCMEFTYCVRGSVKFDCNGATTALLPGGVFATRPKDVHRLRVNAKGSCVYWLFVRMPKRGVPLLGLPPEESQWLLERLSSFPRHDFSGGPDIPRAFKSLFAAYDGEPRGTPSRSFRMRQAAQALLLALADAGNAGSRPAPDLTLAAVIDRMRRHPEEHFPPDRLVAETRLSPSTLLNRFRQFTGLPPHAFLVKCRIRCACKWLEETDRSVGEIAAELRFASPQHFATRFRQETGSTPIEWRRRGVGRK